jgi:putative ABC transport system permease protein
MKHTRNESKPPRLAHWLLKKFANRDEFPAIEGDFTEEFYEHRAEHGSWRARLWFWALVLVSFPSFIKHVFIWSGTMFKNYLTVAVRIIKRHKGFSFINILGLSLGMAASILIGLYIQHELSFDRHHANSDRIHRVCIRLGEADPMRGAFTVPPMAAAMKSEFPEIEEAVRISPWPRNYLVKSGDKQFLEKGIIYADGSIFSVFTIPFILGSPENALTEPQTIVLSQTAARKYFDTDNPVGRTLRFQDLQRDFKITGVVADCPATSHLRYEMIASLSSQRSSRDTGWGGHTYFTYLLLKPGVPPAQLESKFPDFVRRHWGAHMEAQTGMRFDELLKQDRYRYGYFLEPLTAIHLNPSTEVTDQVSVKGSRSTLFIFMTIALIILVIACINFMNLSTARFAHRSKEVGMRKVLGSNRRQLVLQFMGESFLLSALGLILALLLILLVLPAFGHLAQRDLQLSILLQPAAGLLILAVTLGVGLLAGSYPALFLSAFQPLQSLRGSRAGGSKGHIALRRGLVMLQFGITFAVFFGTFVIASQLRFLRHTDLGFDKEKILVIHRAYNLGKQREVFKQELLRFPEIKTISDTDTLPGRHYDANGHRLEGRPASEERTIYTMYADHRLLDLLDLTLVSGRYFSPDIPTDWTSAVVINQTAAREWSLENPLEHRFLKEYGDFKEGEFVSIIGVVQDFHFQSLHQQIQPMIIRPLSNRDWVFTCLKVQSHDLPAVLGRIEQTWDRLSGGQPLEYSFLDEDFDTLYRREQRMGSIFSIFAGLAITVACLGLFGLVSFNAEKRTKEIGIRKVLGAGTGRIVFLLSREVITLVLAAAVLAAPLAFYFMRNWLQNFAFRITINPILFLLTAAATLGIALLTISYRALKAGHADPAQALKHE